MNIIERLLGNALMQRAQAEGERLAGAGGGPESLPLPLRAALGTINPLGVPLRLKAALDQDTAAGRMLSGALDMGVGGYLGAVADVQHRLDPAMPGREAIPQKYQRAAQAYGATDSDVFDRLYAANEAAARGNEIGQGLQNAITDPANLLGPAAKLARAAQLAELAKLLSFADDAQNVPFQLAGKGLAAGDRKLLGGAGARGIENTAQAVRQLQARLLLRQVADAVIPAAPLTRPDRLPDPALPLAPDRAGYNQAAKKVGLPPLTALPDEASPLVPRRTPNLLQLARDGNGVVETGRLGLPLLPDATDLRVALSEQGLPPLTRMVDPPSPLVPEQVPHLLRLARAAQQAQSPAPRAPRVEPPAFPETLRREPSFQYGPPTILQEAAQRLGITARPSQAPNRVQDLLDAARGMVKPLATPPTPTSPLSASTGTLDDLRALLAGPWSTSQYVPEANGIAKRLGVPVEQAQQWVDALIADGTLTRTPLGDLAFAPRTGKIGQDFPVVDPRLTAAMQDVNPNAVPSGALTAADEAAARLANEDALAGEPRMPTAPDFPHFATRDEGLASLTPDEVQTLVDVAYPSDAGQGNALLKRGNPAELASRAIDRITGTATDSPSYRSIEARGRLAVLAQRDPALARKIALLPEATGAVLPDMANVDIPAAPTSRVLPEDIRWGRQTDFLKPDSPFEYPNIHAEGADPAAAHIPDVRPAPGSLSDPLIAEYDQLSAAYRAAPDAQKAALFGPLRDVAARLNAARVAEGQRPLFTENTVGEAIKRISSSPIAKGGKPKAKPAAGDIAAGGVTPPTAQPTVLKGKQGTLVIAQTRGDIGRGADPNIPATIYGDLALHKNVNGAGYGVTHIPTGMSLATDPTQAGAKRIVQAVLDSGADLGFADVAATDHANLVRIGEAIMEARRIPSAPAGDIAAGGGGGMGLGITPLPYGAIWRTGATALSAGVGGTLGGGVGAFMGFQGTNGDLKTRLTAAKNQGLDSAIAGGVIGAGVGLGLSRNTTGNAAEAIAKHAWRGFKTGQAETVAARGASGGLLRWGDIWPALRAARIQHPKNALQDEAFGTAVTGALQPGALKNLPALREAVASRLATAKTADDLLPTLTQARRVAMGLDQRTLNLGNSMMQEEKASARVLSDTANMLVEGGASLLSPVGIASNVAGVALGAAKGKYRGGLRGAFMAVNDTTNGTFRIAIYDDELAQLAQAGAEDFLARLQRQGVDVSTLAPDGSFSPQDVAALAGATAGRQWHAISQKADDLAQARARFLMGNYGHRAHWEQVLGGPVPYASWVVRAYPVALAIAAEHPLVALGLYHWLKQKTDAKAGQPDHTRGMIPVPTSTPYLGALLASQVPGNKGVVYVDPLGAISPVGGDMFSAGEDEADMTWYQKATKWLNRTGLPGVNPAIQTAAYVTGLDYKGPGSLSNTQGLESALSLFPLNVQLPNVGTQALAGTRAKLSPITAPAVGGKADPYAAAYDPLSKRYGELVFEQTKKPLSDPSNAVYLVGMTDPDNPLMQQARRDVLLSGMVKNLVSLTSPVATIAQGQTPKDYKSAQNAMPFSDERIATAVPALAAAMQDANRHHRLNQPVTGIYQGTKPYQREDILQAQWADQPDTKFVQRVLPKSYALQKKTQALELWEYDNRALKRSNPVEYARQLAKKKQDLGLD